jgi:hypothetical protein
MSANRIRQWGDDGLEAELRNLSPCDVPAGLAESLLAAIPVRFGKRTTRVARRRRAALLLAVAACVSAAIGVPALILFESPHPSTPGQGASGHEPAPLALNTHAEETRPCDVLPPLPE